MVGVDSLADDLRALGIVGQLRRRSLLTPVRRHGRARRRGPRRCAARRGRAGGDGAGAAFHLRLVRASIGRDSRRTGPSRRVDRRGGGGCPGTRSIRAASARSCVELTRDTSCCRELGSGFARPTGFGRRRADPAAASITTGARRSTSVSSGRGPLPRHPVRSRLADHGRDRDGGETRCVSYDRFPGCSRVFAVIEPHVRARGVIEDGSVGRASAQLMAGAAVIEETVALLPGTRRRCSAPNPTATGAPAPARDSGAGHARRRSRQEARDRAAAGDRAR